jgi:hypothetical protein
MTTPELAINTVGVCYSFLNFLAPTYCNVGKGNNNVPDEERILF